MKYDPGNPVWETDFAGSLYIGTTEISDGSVFLLSLNSLNTLEFVPYLVSAIVLFVIQSE